MKKTLGIIATLTTALALTACSSGEDYNGVKRSEAKDACHDRIESLLVSPGTADFEGFTETQYSPSAQGIYVDGHVDSENSMGGTIRTTYQCDVWDDNGTLMVSVTKQSES